MLQRRFHSTGIKNRIHNIPKFLKPLSYSGNNQLIQHINNGFNEYLMNVMSEFELLKEARRCSGCSECFPEPVPTALRKLRDGTIRMRVVTEDIRQ